MSVLDIAPFSYFQSDESDPDDEETVDLRGEVIRLDGRPDTARGARGGDGDVGPTGAERRARPRRSVLRTRLPEGLRISRVRVGSVAKIAAVFFAVGHLAVMGTLVVCWNVLQQLGFVADLENLAVTSLGLETLVIDGQSLFEASAIVSGVLFAVGFLITILLAIVYNAACAFFGGVAVEVGPLRRSTRVFSPRHRGYVSIS